MASILTAKGSDTLGHETNLARAPMWAPRLSDKPVQLALLSGPLVMHGIDFRQVEGPQLTVADQRLVAELTTRFLRAGCPADRTVPITLTDAARVLGYEGGDGGSGRRAARASLARIRSVTFSSTLTAETRFPQIWGLIDSAEPMSSRGGRPWRVRDAGSVTLNKHLARLLEDGSVTFLHYPTWDAISRADAIAGRLWCYLEAERITSVWNYSLFASTTKGANDERYMPAVADLLLLDWPVRRQIAARVRRACGVISEIDARYALHVRKSRTPGMWHLAVHRSRHAPRPPGGPLPLEVLQGWRTAYGPRRPTARQIAMLLELADRRGPEWLRSELETHAPAGDALALTLRHDRALADGERLAQLEHDRAWMCAKEQESAGAEASLGMILNRLAEQGIHMSPRHVTGSSSDANGPITGSSSDDNREFQ